DKKGAKYVNTGDTPIYKKGENLFGINFAKAHCAERLLLVEGNMDVVSLHQAGFENTVAALGTAFKPEQAKLISRYTKEIVLTMDGDSAGQNAIRKASEKLQETGLNIRIVTIPDGKDPDEFIKEFGAAKFNALIDNAINEIEFNLFSAAKTVDVESDAGKVQYLSAAAKILAETSDDIARDLYIGRLCDRFGITRTTLENRVNQLRRQKIKEVRKKEINAVIRPKYSREDVNPERRNSVKGTAAEETLISVLLQHPDLCREAFEKLVPERMLTGLNRRIYARISECYESGRAIDISSFSDFLTPAETGYLVSLQNGVKGAQNPQTVLNDCIRVILEEGTSVNSADLKDVSVDDWANRLKQMIEKKKGN
ncbi:MAG: toprim domain-containing protein, partial [Clostridia bacterium]|nr:toprim domain-containing protein [Clostridia bacterium]